MKSFAVASMIAVVAATSQPNEMQMFEEFVQKYDKQYLSQAEKKRRFKVFKTNLAIINAANKKDNSYTLGITKHADITPMEYRSQFAPGLKKDKMLTSSRNQTMFTAPKHFRTPSHVDWVKKGAVTEIRDQGNCASCWAFSAVGSLEGAMFVAGRTLTRLSEQQLISCDKAAQGCKGGGRIDLAFDFVAHRGLESEERDPYHCAHSSSKKCKAMQCKRGGHKVLAPGDVVDHIGVDASEEALEAAVAQQPVSATINADSSVFQHYKGGVLTSDACGDSLDHSVLIVGYGVLDGKKYWRVKNSWGSDWGDKGYVNIARGSDAKGGECGIRESAWFPTVREAQQVIV